MTIIDMMNFNKNKIMEELFKQSSPGTLEY
jgi:hypothetical protein